MGMGDSNLAKQKLFYSPIRLRHLEIHEITKVEAGGFSAALTSDKQILIWGSG